MCLIIALDVTKILSWFDLPCCAPTTHVHRDYWHKVKSLKHVRRRAAAAALLLYTDFGGSTHSISHSPGTYRSAKPCIYTREHYCLWLSQRRELAQSAAAVVLCCDCLEQRAWRTMCDAVARQQRARCDR